MGTGAFAASKARVRQHGRGLPEDPKERPANERFTLAVEARHVELGSSQKLAHLAEKPLQMVDLKIKG